jgi:hypothetical protein
VAERVGDLRTAEGTVGARALGQELSKSRLTTFR